MKENLYKEKNYNVTTAHKKGKNAVLFSNVLVWCKVNLDSFIHFFLSLKVHGCFVY